MIKYLLKKIIKPLPPGRIGERLAERNMKAAGYKVLARNLVLEQGEIDILLESPDKTTIVVVEVKTAAGRVRPEHRPELRVGAKKKAKLTALARSLCENPKFKKKINNRPIRFDVVGVELNTHLKGVKPVLRHLPGAFQVN